MSPTSQPTKTAASRPAEQERLERRLAQALELDLGEIVHEIHNEQDQVVEATSLNSRPSRLKPVTATPVLFALKPWKKAGLKPAAGLAA